MGNLDIKLKVDASGLSCPLPILKATQGMKTIAPGRADGGGRDGSGLGQGLRRLVQVDRQRARRAGLGRRQVPLRASPQVAASSDVGGPPLDRKDRMTTSQPHPPPKPPDGAVKPKKLVIIDYSGELEKTWATMILASTAGAMEMETTVFVTFWGLQTFVKDKKRITGENWMQKMMSFMQRPGVSHRKLSKMNFMGMGPWMMFQLAKKYNVSKPKDLLEMAQAVGRQVPALPDDDGHVRPQGRRPRSRAWASRSARPRRCS